MRPAVPNVRLVARIFVCPSDRADVVREAARFAIAAYINVPVYAAFHEWLGRGEVFGPMWDAWKSGDRKAALAAIPDEVVDDLIVHGSPAACRAHIQRVLRQRCDDQLARHHAARSRALALGRGPVAGPDGGVDAPPRLMPRRQASDGCGVDGRLCRRLRGLAAGEQLAQLGDVLKAPAAGRLVEAELQRDVRSRAWSRAAR